jgi:hypothetical protein
VTDEASIETPPSPGTIALLVTKITANPSRLVFDLSARGCVVAVVAIIEAGRWQVYVNGAPAAVNAMFPTSIAARTPVFVRCQ